MSEVDTPPSSITSKDRLVHVFLSFSYSIVVFFKFCIGIR